MRIQASLFTLSFVTLFACGGADEPAEVVAPEPAEVATEEVAAEEVAVEEVVAEEAPFDAAGTYAVSCASCHGASGEGDGAAAAALPVTPANFADASFWETRTDEEVANVITNGGAAVGKSPLMVAFGPMLGDNVPAMVAYLHSFSSN